MSPSIFEIFLIFLNFLNLHVLSGLETRDATHIQSLQYKILSSVSLMAIKTYTEIPQIAKIL